LLSRHHSTLLVVDVQARLIPSILGHRRLVWNIRRLLEGAQIWKLPVLATEQYPQGLGKTVPELAEKLSDVQAKLTFSGCGCVEMVQRLRDTHATQVLIAGIETHVCILQTVFDLMTEGYDVFVPADAVGTRHRVDHHWALRRMAASGATITTTEAALFEWCEASGSEEFKRTSALVRQSPPKEKAEEDQQM
jgi:nicotinamidase-related amidase